MSYINQIKDLKVDNIIITKIEGKKHIYNIDCDVNGKFCCFYFNTKLKKTTSSSLVEGDKRCYPDLGGNFRYIIGSRINKEINDILVNQ